MKYGFSYLSMKINYRFVMSIQDVKWKSALYETTNNTKPLEIVGVPKISIVMPSYNQVSFIERSILSILNQDYPNYELIIIDGGSTDGTVDLIKKYQKYVFYFISEKDRGQSDALNKGFSRATGDVFCWMNSDDIFMPGAFNSVASYFKRGRSVVFGDVLAIDSEDNTERYQIAFPFSVNQFIYDNFVHNAQSMFWDKNIHQKFGMFSEDLTYTMDYDFIVRLCIICSPRRWKFISKPLAAFRCYEGQKTGSAHELAMLEHRIIAKRLGFQDKFSKHGKRLKFIYYLNRIVWYCIRCGSLIVRSAGKKRQVKTYEGGV